MTTGALKMYFRELPEPLFTYALFHDFVSAISTSWNFFMRSGTFLWICYCYCPLKRPVPGSIGFLRFVGL